MSLVRLPDELRSELKSPMGEVSREVRRVEGRLVTVGDVVSYTFLEAGVEPDLVLFDGRTEREPVDDEVVERLQGLRVYREVENPPATLTRGLLRALRDGLDGGPRAVRVEGEEDLATLPAIVVADDGDTVVYGQPGEGMVYVEVDEDARERALELLGRMDVEDEAELGRLLGVS